MPSPPVRFLRGDHLVIRPIAPQPACCRIWVRGIAFLSGCASCSMRKTRTRQSCCALPFSACLRPLPRAPPNPGHRQLKNRNVCVHPQRQPDLFRFRSSKLTGRTPPYARQKAAIRQPHGRQAHCAKWLILMAAIHSRSAYSGCVPHGRRSCTAPSRPRFFRNFSQQADRQFPRKPWTIPDPVLSLADPVRSGKMAFIISGENDHAGRAGRSKSHNRRGRVNRWQRLG